MNVTDGATLPTVRVTVDQELCASTGGCSNICPDVFEMDASGYVVVLVNEPDGSLSGDVLEAANLCPTGAIQISP